MVAISEGPFEGLADQGGALERTRTNDGTAFRQRIADDLPETSRADDVPARQ